MLYALENARIVSASERRLFADFIRLHSVTIQRHVAGCAVASSSTLHRGALTALGWLVPLPFPTYVCATISEGKAWLQDRLASGSDTRS